MINGVGQIPSIRKEGRGEVYSLFGEGKDVITSLKLSSAGLLRIGEGNMWLKAASFMKEPRELWMKTWYEGEVCCLFSDSNLGKSIYAVQIGLHVAKMGLRVIYCDFELSEKQFQLRYTDGEGNLLDMPGNFLRADFNPDGEVPEGVPMEVAVLEAIEQAAIRHKADCIVVDNITYLNMLTESGDAAAELMTSLMRLKKLYGWSLLVLAHTPKRVPGTPLTPNDLAGSKRLFNFFDSVIAIGRCVNDENLRYVKQLKVRHGAFTFDADNVQVNEIVKQGCFLRFSRVKECAERELLSEPSLNRDANVMSYLNQGMSFREIAERMGISKSTVGKIAKRLK